jgi:thioesterase domain-containing protein
MASVLEARFGKPVRTLDLHHNTTPVKFARWLAKDQAEIAVGAIAIQKNGHRVPFIGVHLLGDRAALYRPPSAALGADYPVWGVSVGAPKALSDVDIPRIAEQYRQDIEKSFPTGPFALGAVSLASFFAYELAQRLVASGREVRLLAIFDAEGPSGRPSRKGWDKIRAHLAELLLLGPAHLDRVRRLRADRRLIDAELTAAVTENEVTGAGLVQANIRAVDAYQPQPINCPPVVYRAAANYWDAQSALDDALGWRGVAAQGIDLVDVPGDHFGILRPGNVTAMANELGKRLRR